MDAPGKPRLCSLERGSDGYGFNLHGEKGQHGQYIRAVDEGSAAQLAGLCTGDRVIEVNGTNIERETHTQVVSRIKAGGSSTSLLVVDKELDRYCRNNSITIKASMADGGVGEDSPRVNGDHLEESEGMMPMNGDASGMGGHEVIQASIEEHQESAPERHEEEVEDEHPYAEVERRQEQEEEDEVDEQFAAVLAGAAIEDGERREVEEEDVVQAEEVTMEESVPGPPIDRDEDSDVSLPEPEPEPILEAATVPVVESAPADFNFCPPQVHSEADESDPEPERMPTPEPVREPTPEPVREPTPEPVREPTPEPVREPTPEPVRAPTPEPVRAPTPEPVRQPTPEPEPKPVVHKPTRTESVPPSRPAAPPTSRQASLNVDSNKSGLNLSSMEKARILAAGRKKKKQASSKNWEDKYAAFNQL